jgi:hypothetical protein
LRLQIQGAKTTRIAKLVAERMAVRWDAQSARSTSSQALRFDGTSFSTKGREPADGAVTIITARHGGEWPSGKTVHVTRPQGVEGAGWPTTLTMAVLLESSVNGWVLPPEVRLLGALTPSGIIESGQNELYHFLQAAPQGEPIMLVPTTAQAALEDQLLQGSLARLTEARYFGVASLDEIGTVLEGLKNKTWEAQLQALSNLQKALASKGIALLRTPEARAALAEMSRFCPPLLNAKILAAAAEGKLISAYSVNGSAHRLFALHEEYEEQRSLLQTDTPESHKKAKEFKDALLALRPLVSPKYKTVVEKLDELFDAARDAVRFDAKETSSKAKKARSALEDAQSKAAGEVVRLESEIGLGHSAK